MQHGGCYGVLQNYWFSITTVQSNESLGQCQPSPLAELNNDSTVNNDSPPAPAVASVVPVVVEGE